VEEAKILKHEANVKREGGLFVPFVMDTFGNFGNKASTVLVKIASGLAAIDGRTVDSVVKKMKKQIIVRQQKLMANSFGAFRERAGLSRREV